MGRGGALSSGRNLLPGACIPKTVGSHLGVRGMPRPWLETALRTAAGCLVAVLDAMGDAYTRWRVQKSRSTLSLRGPAISISSSAICRFVISIAVAVPVSISCPWRLIAADSTASSRRCEAARFSRSRPILSVSIGVRGRSGTLSRTRRSHGRPPQGRGRGHGHRAAARPAVPGRPPS